MRGNHQDGSCRYVDSGSIPACAGEPRTLPNARRDEWVYPRVCGGTCALSYTTCALGGLSPRVRGNQDGRGGVIDLLGSIPACAGEPRRRVRIISDGMVYPRVCGGTPARSVTLKWRTGLSPRVRGNRHDVEIWLGKARSIPACAGEPLPLQGVRRTARVYPRVCGGTVARD